MSGYKEYSGSGSKVKYFSDNKTLILEPTSKKEVAQFKKLRSKLDTLLQVDGQKQVGNSLSLKLSDTFNINVDELLKSLGLKGGVEKEDAASMTDDAVKQKEEQEGNLQNSQPQSQQPLQPQSGIQQQNPGLGPPPADLTNQQLPESLNLSVVSFLFEDFTFQKKRDKTRRKAKRFGKYWDPIERFSGKNKNAIKPADILEIRKKYSIKPQSSDRDLMLQCLDKAASYFFDKLEQEKGINVAQEFDEKYVSIDSLRPDDYNIDSGDADAIIQNQPQMSLVPDFDEVNYDDIDIEK